MNRGSWGSQMMSTVWHFRTLNSILIYSLLHSRALQKWKKTSSQPWDPTPGLHIPSTTAAVLMRSHSDAEGLELPWPKGIRAAPKHCFLVLSWNSLPTLLFSIFSPYFCAVLNLNEFRVWHTWTYEALALRKVEPSPCIGPKLCLRPLAPPVR